MIHWHWVITSVSCTDQDVVRRKNYHEYKKGFTVTKSSWWWIILEKAHSNIWVSFKQLQLNQDDKRILANGQWLNDKHISMAQSLIQNQFPKLNGLMSSLLQLNKPVPNSTNALQVINTGRSHWVLISTINCLQGEVRLYDPLYTSLSKNRYCEKCTRDTQDSELKSFKSKWNLWNLLESSMNLQILKSLRNPLISKSRTPRTRNWWHKEI